MAYDFAGYEPEPEAQASGRSSGPPGKFTGVGVLDPRVPPKRPLGPWRITVAAILIALAAMTIMLVLARH